MDCTQSSTARSSPGKSLWRLQRQGSWRGRLRRSDPRPGQVEWFQRALETAYGTIDFLVESVVVQVEAADGRGPEEFRRLGVLLECHGYPSGVLLTSRYQRPFETEWHTREAVSLPVQILPIQTVRR